MIRDFLNHPTTPYYPLMFGLLLVLWGVWILLPGSAFATSLGYHWLTTLVPEAAAGVVAISIGIFEMLGAVFCKARPLVIMGSLGAFYFWLFLTLSFIVGDWHSAGVVVYGWLCVMSGFGYINWRIHR